MQFAMQPVGTDTESPAPRFTKADSEEDEDESLTCATPIMTLFRSYRGRYSCLRKRLVGGDSLCYVDKVDSEEDEDDIPDLCYTDYDTLQVKQGNIRV